MAHHGAARQQLHVLVGDDVGRPAPCRMAVPLKRMQPWTSAPFSTVTPGKRMEFTTVPSMLQPSATRELRHTPSGPM